MIVRFVLLHFVAGGFHSALNLVFIVGGATTEALFQLFQCTWHNKYGDNVAIQKWVALCGFTHLRGTLHVDIK